MQICASVWPTNTETGHDFAHSTKRAMSMFENMDEKVAVEWFEAARQTDRQRGEEETIPWQERMRRRRRMPVLINGNSAALSLALTEGDRMSSHR